MYESKKVVSLGKVRELGFEGSSHQKKATAGRRKWILDYSGLRQKINRVSEKRLKKITEKLASCTFPQGQVEPNRLG